MAETIPAKTQFDFFVVWFPLVASLFSLWLGKLWEGRNLKQSKEFSLERDRINNQREKRLEVFDLVLVDIGAFAKNVENVIRNTKACHNYEKKGNNSAHKSENFLKLNKMVNQEIESLIQKFDTLFVLETRLTIIGLERSVESLNRMNQIVLEMNNQEISDPLGVDFDGAMKEVRELSAKLMVDLRIQFELISSGKFEGIQVELSEEN